jgi:2-C-methyl-D-erythritol 4-phosphate cytidylyltransferase
LTKPRGKLGVVAIVPAAGLGKRFGPGKNKPFQTLCGKPIIVWPLETMESVPAIDEIIPVLKAEDMELGQRIFEEYNLSKIKRIAAGGRERQDSVYNGLKLIEDENCAVLIHDGVRPLIESELIENAIGTLITASSPPLEKGGKEGFSRLDGVVLGVPLKDTIKEADDGIVKKTLRRESLWAVQTPQVFLYKRILAAYDRAINDGFYSTDDSALMEHYGGKVKIVPGSYRNIKITTPEDILIAEAFLKNNSQFNKGLIIE